MNIHADKLIGNKDQSSAKDIAKQHGTALQLQDNRPRSVTQLKQTGVADSMHIAQRKRNTTGLPNQLKNGVESLSGHSMDDVKVHFNSDKPAQFNAHAYAQGTDIHIASGQEKHLPHEAWHVVQQKEGRVKPTRQMKGKVCINDDTGLEKEADIMGSKALQAKAKTSSRLTSSNFTFSNIKQFVWARWYEFDGDNYHARWVGLPAATGWIKLEQQHEGKDVYMSANNYLTKNPTIKRVEEGVLEVKNFMKEKTPLLKNVIERVEEQEITIERLQDVQTQFVSFNQELGNVLSKTSTVLKLLGASLGLTIAIGGGYILSLVSLPAWLVASVDGLSFLYSCYLIYRWSKSTLLPTMVKVALLAVNISTMTVTTGITLGRMAAYLAGLLENSPFEHIQFAAIPFALLLEHFIVKAIEKINEMRKKRNKEGGHDEEHES